MSISTIARAYRDKEITAQEAFERVTKAGLLPEAFMQLLLNALEDQEAYDSLVCGDKEPSSVTGGRPTNI